MKTSQACPYEGDPLSLHNVSADPSVIDGLLPEVHTLYDMNRPHYKATSIQTGSHNHLKQKNSVSFFWSWRYTSTISTIHTVIVIIAKCAVRKCAVIQQELFL